MADEKKNIDIIINTAQSAKSVGELKKALKDLSFAQEEVDKSSPDFQRLTDSINEVEGRVGDLNDAFKTFAGSGVERLNASTGLLSESISSLDMGKLKVGLQGLKALPKALAGDITQLSTSLSKSNLNFKTLGSSMKGLAKSGVGELTKSIISLGKAILTNPILLLAAVIAAIVVAVVKFYDKIKPVKAIVEALGQAIDFVVQMLKDLGDALGLTSFAAEESAERQIDAINKTKAAVEKRYDNEIKFAQAAGKETKDIEKKKQEFIRESIKKQIAAIEQLAEVTGEFTEEQKKQIAELREAYTDSTMETALIDIKAAREKKERAEKSNEETLQKLRDLNKKAAEEKQKAEEDAKKKAEEAYKARIAANEAFNKKIKDQEIARIQDTTERELARAEEDNKRAIEEISKSKASEEVKNAAKIEQELTYQAQIAEIKKKADEDRLAKEKETLDKAKDLRVKALSDVNALEQVDFEAKIIAAGNNEMAILQIKMDALQSEKETKIAIAKETGENIDLINQEYANKEAELIKQNEQLKIDEAKRAEEEKQQILDKGLNAAQSLTGAFFSFAQNAAKNDAKKQLELKKKQFKVDKAFNIVRATIDGVRSVQAALTQSPPASYIMAAINGVMAAANIAKIASSKFEGGETSGGSTPTTSVPSSASIATPPASSNFVAPQFFGLGQGSSSDKKINKVVVVETDITKTQKNVNKIETRATQSL